MCRMAVSCTHRWRVVFFMGAALLAALVYRNATAGQNRPTFTVKETIAASLILPEKGWPWHLYAKANPGARQALYGILNDNAMRKYHAGALRTLGYIGNDEDARLIEQVLARYKGALEGPDSRAGMAVFDALGVMARGSEQARTSLKAMTQMGYWEAKGLQWDTETVLKKRPDRRFEVVVRPLGGYALANTGDLPDVVESVRKAIDDEKIVAQLFGERLDAAELTKRAQNVLADENRPVSVEDRRAIESVCKQFPALVEPNASLAKGSVELTAEERASVDRTIEEALAAYMNTRASIMDGKQAGLAPTLLDNGQPLDAKKYERLRAEYEKDLAREAEVFNLLDQRGSKPMDFIVRRETTYQAEATPSGSTGAIAKSEIISVTFRLSNSSAVGDVLFPRNKGSLTVSKDGTLIAVMKKIGGNWYWNPFGW